MALHDMLESARAGEPVTVEEGWTQGRAVFGGLTGALLLAAMRGRLDPAEPVPLRSLTVSFVAPAGPGPLEVEAEVLRAGKNVTQARASLVQGEQVVATALASFGRHRRSALRVGPRHPAPALPDADGIEPAPHVPGLTPDFFRFVDLRMATGAYPFTGTDSSGMSGWTALREAPAEFRDEHLVLLTDAWPPAVLQMLTEFAPASSLTWTLELVAEVPEGLAGDARWAYEVATDSARDGYAHTHAMLWAPDGTLTAISRQTVTVFG